MRVTTFQDDWTTVEAESFREVVVENRSGDRVVVQEIAGRLMLKDSDSRFVRREPQFTGSMQYRRDVVSGA